MEMKKGGGEAKRTLGSPSTSARLRNRGCSFPGGTEPVGMIEEDDDGGSEA